MHMRHRGQLVSELRKLSVVGGPPLRCMPVRTLDLGSRQGLVRSTEGYDRLLTCMREVMQLDFAVSRELITVALRSDFAWQRRGLDVNAKGCTKGCWVT